MKLAIFAESKKSPFVTGRLKQEALSASHEVEILDYQNLEFALGEKTKILHNNKELSHFDAVILRLASEKGLIFYKDILARYFLEKGVFVLNGQSYIDFMHLGKLTQNFVLSEGNLPIVPTRVFAREALIDPSDLVFPVIVKKSLSRLGKGVIKIDDEENLKQLLGPNSAEFLVQKFLKTGEDFRIFVVGGRALPKAMKKKAPDGSFITNVAQGGITSSLETSDEVRTLAEGAAKAFNADYCGVDIMFDEEGRAHILEINRSANFQGFEEATGLNVAAETISFLESKVK